MSFNLWSWLLDSLPWQFQVGAALVVALLILWLLVRVFGWERVKPFVIPVLGVIGAAGLLSRSRQQGYADRKAQEADAEKKGETVVTKEQTKVKNETDAQLDQGVDKWSR